MMAKSWKVFLLDPNETKSAKSPWSRDVDGISRSRDIPRLSRDQNIPGVRIPGVWLSRNPGIFNPRILNPGKSRNKISRDFLFAKIPECFKEVPGYPGIFFFLFPNKFAFILCLVHTKSRIENKILKSMMIYDILP